MATSATVEERPPEPPGSRQPATWVVVVFVAVAAAVIGLTIWTAIRTSSAAPLVILGVLLGIDALVLWVTARAPRRRGRSPRIIGRVLIVFSGIYLLWFATNPFGAALPGGLMLPDRLTYGSRTYQLQKAGLHVYHGRSALWHGNVCFMFSAMNASPAFSPFTGSVELPTRPVGLVRVLFGPSLHVAVDAKTQIDLWVSIPSANCSVDYVKQPGR